MVEHTPGPWRVEDEPEDKETTVDYGSGFTICQVFSFDHEVRLADARLISAAPDLLAACRSVLDVADRDSQTEPWEGQLRAAIAKATATAPGE